MDMARYLLTRCFPFIVVSNKLEECQYLKKKQFYVLDYVLPNSKFILV